ncbi:MAG: phosphonate metabolism protein/1,5-bisphosphokinase (PRPP-forming) PhnN [Thalassobaculaceae bacterium]|nr:phosphonate metabolism protein/1,5-bisphosphokinase (PRPP-forming) PhnN [Thalassobaculaceae bacterium]
MATRGTLILIVGPSGSGKDTLIDAARAVLATDPRFHFPRRDITRPAEAGGEDHNPVDTATFEARRAAGAYALSWGAHDLFYGVPAEIGDRLAAGTSVVVNVSRAVIDEARGWFRPTAVISLSVPENVLRARLSARGRETTEQIESRVARAAAVPVSGPNVFPVVNDSTIETAIARFLDAVETAETLTI